jgi:hypothetical protein
MTDNSKTLVQTLIEIYGRIGDFHIVPCDGAILISEADRLAEKAVEDYTNAILSEERAKVGAWLRKSADWHDENDDGLSGFGYIAQADRESADSITRGDHLK